MTKSFFLFLILLLSTQVYGQDKKYLVYFKDKQNNPYSISNPTSFLTEKAIIRRQNQGIAVTLQDLPVTPVYLSGLIANGATVLYTLKWLNAALIEADPTEIAAINSLPFVIQSNPYSAKMKVNELHNYLTVSAIQENEAFYGFAYNQLHMIEVDQMHQDGYKGEGKTIALLDSGFLNADSTGCLSHLYTNSKITATYDFVDSETDVYDDHDHGLKVLTTIVAYLPDTLIGSAYNASYVLLRTEDVFSETEVEEVNWAKGAEYADSIGADIISSSLGYYAFDAPWISHSYSDLDGKTTLAAKAANTAASKGILVFNSAGNEGALPWHYIITPADGDSVLAIGAVNAFEQYANFSSVGPSSDNQIKPDLAAMGQSVTVGNPSGGYSQANGTSFSCPLVAGLAAGIWQAYPSLTNMQLADVMRRSASQYYTPDVYLGYGIPGYRKAITHIQDSIAFSESEIRIFPNPIQSGKLTFSVVSSYFLKEVDLKLYDNIGKLVAEDKVKLLGYKNESNIDFTNMTSGLYYLRIYFRDKVFTAKLIKL